MSSLAAILVSPLLLTLRVWCFVIAGKAHSDAHHKRLRCGGRENFLSVAGGQTRELCGGHQRPAGWLRRIKSDVHQEILQVRRWRFCVASQLCLVKRLRSFVHGRDFDIDLSEDVSFFNMENLRCSAIVRFPSRRLAMRAVRDKHMGVMQNHEVHVMPLN